MTAADAIGNVLAFATVISTTIDWPSFLIGAGLTGMACGFIGLLARQADALDERDRLRDTFK